MSAGGLAWRVVILVSLVVSLATVAAVAPEDTAKPDCGRSLQSLVDAAAPGTVVDVPSCVYRERVSVDKEITLDARPGAEIRGSDVWTGWERSGGYWVEGPLPNFTAHGRCSVGERRCLWPGQVFFDGEALEQVASDPESEQFAVDANRDVLLADDPAGHTVEVTTRTGWIVGHSEGVIIRGFTMKHSANDSQNGAIENNGHSRWTIEGNELSDAHGAVVSLTGGTDLRVLGNEIYRGGQLGVHASGGELLLRGNEIHHNNTEGFDPGWTAGGVKTSRMQSLLADRNDVHHNGGTGFWCDLDCRNVTYSDNRIHHNEQMGINFEISSTAEMFGNVVWENGWGKPGWGWGAGILASSSKDLEIHDNIIAWNADGIVTVSADRDSTEHDEVTNVLIHHNTILAKDYPRDAHNFALAWLQAWDGDLFEPASQNRGSYNRYWYPSPESSLVRFAWYRKGRNDLADFNTTPGEEDGRYLTTAEKNQVVSSARLPAFPTSGPPASAGPPVTLGSANGGGAGMIVSGELEKWHRLTLSFAGPDASEMDASPNNPFLDYRLNVTFTGPGGQQYVVPGFFDGDGNGGATGNVWRVHFSPDQAGTWSYRASFRTGTNVAVDLSPTAGTPTSFDGASGTLDVAELDPTAPGFLKWGRLEYVGEHYLKFRDGPYWLKGGVASPENLLGYTGFDNTPNAHHTFSPHVQDWQTEDPTFNSSSTDAAGKGLVGAMNYLSSQGVNSIYFLPMNIGGDGKDTSPYVGPLDWAGSTSNDNEHFDISKLLQWESAFTHAQQRGIQLHFVLNEAEEANKRELDDATLDTERKLFYREMIARFGHHNALQWNVSEEYDYKYPLSPDMVKAFADYIQQTDPYDHPITVHQQGNPHTTWAPFLGDSRFSITSFQYSGSVAGYGSEVEQWRQKSASAGRPIAISMDELASATPTNAIQQRKTILWPTYLSGGQLEWFMGSEDQSLEDFRRYEELWTYTRHARTFMQENLPFWEMEPQDDLLSGESADYGGGQVFAIPGQIYAVYLPNATSSGTLDLSGASGSFRQSWYNPRTGSFHSVAQTLSGGGERSLGTPPYSTSNDWVVVIEKV